MNPITPALTAIIALSLSGLLAQKIQAGVAFEPAVPTVTNVITIAATVWEQNQDSIDNGTNTITPPPIVTKVTTKTLLKQLALDKFAQGSYGATNFPAGAKLVVFESSPGAEDAVFQVVGRTNNFLVDVSDIISLETGENSIFSGRVNNDTDLANSTVTDRTLISLIFDDTDIVGGGDIKFFLSGISKSVTTDTKPNEVTGLYKETQTHTTGTAIGEGTIEGTEFVISGSIDAGGKATLLY